MKLISQLSVIFLISVCLSYGKDVQIVELTDTSTITKVVIKLDGVIILNNSQSNLIQVRTNTEVIGDILGLSNQDEISEYKINTSQSGSTLTLEPEARKKVWSVGVNTRRELHTHHVNLPENVFVEIISDDSDIMVNGEFSTLIIDNLHGDIEVMLNESNIRYLKCFTDSGEINLNENPVKNGFTHVASGASIVELASGSGSINLKGRLSTDLN